MWPFSTKQGIEKSGLMSGITDWHSHVLPGVDDGIDNIEESLDVINRYEELGVDTLWLTPHIMEDMPNTTDDLRKRYEHLCSQYQGKVHLRLGAENMLDNLFEQRLATKDFLPIGNSGNHLLVETSYFTPPADFDDKIARTFSAGYFPVLAHPERYIYMDTDDYDSLHERNVKMQLNILSLFGFYGKTAQKKAKYILENGYYHMIGSDTHRYGQIRKFLEVGRISKKHLSMIKNLPGIE